ncbi:type IX secretion system motor protein PorM/GldM [Flavobacterium aciduliphilum]|uniref:Protein involved in gliding motility GldM n=1 Tax=Flavobacterium aciduliphilum TaxID=1101402 RepID=A0A328YLX3_9FLAO|nr:gliding motility protein GldM [Flavobacterium aciduliphilum]RAR71567.1 protein involved in gliding motility GldM [Flavobacterium aciduliphilum]
MAGGKLTPRQKMINLMYLVFIAMLALNMSKEVLSAFGLMNEKFENANTASLENNKKLLTLIDQKGAENAGMYGPAKNAADKIAEISKTFYEYIGTLKADATNGVEIDKKTGKLPYEAMDKGPHIDETWFKGDNYSAKGTAIVAAINKYVADMKAAVASEPSLSKKLSPIIADLDAKFNTSDVKDHDGVTKKYLSYHFEHFPAIASLAKLTAWQNDVKKAEFDCYSSLLGGAAVDAASMKNYTAMVVLEKSAYFQGEAVKGKVVLGRYDENTKPTSFQGPGKIENGQAVISMTAGSIGEQNINGQFTFMEDGKPVPLKFEGKYVVIPRPNSANISADKMNVVYRGLPNPMTISFAGIGDNNVTASAPGLTKAGANGKYILNPGSGDEVLVTVNGKMSDGKTVTDKKAFRIKGIPAPQAAIGGTIGSQKGAKSRLQSSQITAVLPDFLYDLKFQVTQFVLKVPGQASIVVNGDRLNAQCVAALGRAVKGDQITISDVKTKIVGEGSGIQTKTAAPAIFELQ